MEIASIQPERENPSPINSPNSNESTTTTAAATSNSSGVHIQTPPVTPKPTSRSETNPYPTTFVQADTASFKQVVQMLTGSSETATKPPSSDQPPPSRGYSIPPIKTGQQKKQGFKLYERRNSLKNGLMISPSIGGGSGHNSGFSPRRPEILSPSMLNFPRLVLSPVTPLIEDPFNKSSPSVGSSPEEEKAMAEKGFYLHPSPRTSSEPRLLPLFPVTSPRVSESSS